MCCVDGAEANLCRHIAGKNDREHYRPEASNLAIRRRYMAEAVGGGSAVAEVLPAATVSYTREVLETAAPPPTASPHSEIKRVTLSLRRLSYRSF